VLSQILRRAKAGSLAYSTYESYETTARVVVVPRCGGARVDGLTVGRCDRILQRVLEEETISKASRARVQPGHTEWRHKPLPAELPAVVPASRRSAGRISQGVVTGMGNDALDNPALHWTQMLLAQVAFQLGLAPIVFSFVVRAIERNRVAANMTANAFAG
jgi:hypothetical protein